MYTFICIWRYMYYSSTMQHFSIENFLIKENSKLHIFSFELISLTSKCMYCILHFSFFNLYASRVVTSHEVYIGQDHRSVRGDDTNLSLLAG
jgi:uncharacterized protein with WD repeat